MVLTSACYTVRFPRPQFHNPTRDTRGSLTVGLRRRHKNFMLYTNISIRSHIFIPFRQFRLGRANLGGKTEILFVLTVGRLGQRIPPLACVGTAIERIFVPVWCHAQSLTVGFTASRGPSLPCNADEGSIAGEAGTQNANTYFRRAPYCTFSKTP